MSIHILRRILPPLAAALLLFLLIMQAQPAYGDPPPPSYREADSCSQLAPSGIIWHEFRIDSPTSGTYSNGYLTVSLDVYQLDGEQVFDWQTNRLIDAIYAAGGPGGNLYQYNPPGPAATVDDGLHAPYNGSGRHYHTLEMILFCSASPLSPTPTAPPTPTTPPTATATNTPEPPTATATATSTSLPPTATATLEPGVTPSATPSATATVMTPGPPPQEDIHFLPLAVNLWQNGEEPNDECSSAYRITPNTTHSFLPDDRDDWFTFTLAAPAELTVRLTEFGPLAGQIAAYFGADCGSRQLLGNNGDQTATKILSFGVQPAGRYFLYVSNDGVFSTTQAYNLLVSAN